MKIFRILCVLFFLAALGFSIYRYWESRQTEDTTYYVVYEPPPEPEPEPIPIPEPVPVPEPKPEPELPYVPVPDSEPEPVPEPEPPELLQSIIQLREYYDNPDIVGHIRIPDTNINYPIAQASNNVFYLYHDLRSNRTSTGSVFLDYLNDFSALSCDNFIIYGHNMRAGNKFHNIRYFNRAEYFHGRPFIYITTPYRETVWEIFSFFHTTTAFCYLTTQFPGRESFYEFITFLQRSSHHATDVVLTPYDQIVILSTCGVFGGENRYILIARLVQNGEDDNTMAG